MPIAWAIDDESGRGERRGLDSGRMRPPLVLGVDGGGTKTDAVLVDTTGLVVARARGGPSNYQDVGRHAAEGEWAELVRSLSDQAEGEVVASAWGLSGCDRPRDEEILHAVLAKVDPAPAAGRDLVNDTFLILSAGSATGSGVAVVSGTGSNCVGIGFDGTRTRIGGLAYEFGDGASGSDIGRDGLRAAFRGEDGRGPRTLLTELLRDTYHLDRLDDIVDLYIADAEERATPGLIAPLVFDAATMGDLVATRILEDAGRELALSVNILASRLFPRSASFPLVLGGSVLQLGTYPAMRAALIEAVHENFAGAVPVVPDAPPVLGAALLALDRLRVLRPESVSGSRQELAERIAPQLEPV